MDKNEKLKIQLAIDEVDTWAKRYQKIIEARNAVRTGAAPALKQLRSKVVPVEVGGQTYHVLPLGPEQMNTLGAFARFIQMAPIDDVDQELLKQLEADVPQAVAEAQRALAAKRPSEDDLEAADFISEYAAWGLHENIPAALERITPATAAPAVNLGNAMAPEYGLANALKAYGTVELLPAAEVRTRLATFTAAERYAELARALTPAHDYLVVCSPPGYAGADLLNAISLTD